MISRTTAVFYQVQTSEPIQRFQYCLDIKNTFTLSCDTLRLFLEILVVICSISAMFARMLNLLSGERGTKPFLFQCYSTLPLNMSKHSFLALLYMLSMYQLHSLWATFYFLTDFSLSLILALFCLNIKCRSLG